MHQQIIQQKIRQPISLKKKKKKTRIYVCPNVLKISFIVVKLINRINFKNYVICAKYERKI